MLGVAVFVYFGCWGGVCFLLFGFVGSVFGCGVYVLGVFLWFFGLFVLLVVDFVGVVVVFCFFEFCGGVVLGFDLLECVLYWLGVFCVGVV